MHPFEAVAFIRWFVSQEISLQSRLSEVVRSALLAAFDQGWADPKKLSQSSARAAILHNQALENIAAHLKVATDSIEVLGEPALGHYLAIAGLLRDDLTFAYSATDKGKIRALARSHRGAVTELQVDDQEQSTLPRFQRIAFSHCNWPTGRLGSCKIPRLLLSYRVMLLSMPHRLAQGLNYPIVGIPPYLMPAPGMAPVV